MIDYQKLYSGLFNAITDSLEELERMNVGLAQDILRRAQQEAEETHLADEDSCDIGVCAEVAQ